MPGGKEDKKDPRPQRNSALLDNLGNNNLEPIENADRLSVRSMPSQRRYPGNAAGPRPGALPGQANESVLKAMKENASPLNVVPKNLNPPQGKEPEEPKKPNPPQGKEPKAAKDPNIIDLEEEEIGIPNLGLRPLVQKQPLIQVPAQNIPANVPNAVIGQPGEIPAPAFPLGPYWTRDEVEPDMIAEHGKGQLKKEAGNNPDDNDRIRNDQLDIEELGRKVYSLFEDRLKESVKKSAGKSASKWKDKISCYYLARAAVRDPETKALLKRLLRSPYGTKDQRKTLGRQYKQLIEICEKKLGKGMLQVIAFDLHQQVYNK